MVLYTRQGCTLCVEMERELARAGCDSLYSLERVDIDADRTLLRRYGVRIPVLEIDGEQAFEGRLRAAEFRDRIRRAVTSVGELD